MVTLGERIARKAFRPFYRPYYRLLWRRSFPGARPLERLIRRFEASSRRGDVPLGREEWDAQYADGRWDFLAAESEAARLRAVAALVRRHAPGEDVLDVGCGAALLLDHLEPGGRYTGIDLSREAIARAEARPEAREAELLIADAESWEPGRSFDAVVLNECLYYLERPLAAVRRYLAFLKPGGVLVASMFRGPRADAIGRRLCAELPPAEALDLAAEKGRWRITVHRRPRLTTPPPGTSSTP